MLSHLRFAPLTEPDCVIGPFCLLYFVPVETQRNQAGLGRNGQRFRPLRPSKASRKCEGTFRYPNMGDTIARNDRRSGTVNDRALGQYSGFLKRQPPFHIAHPGLRKTAAGLIYFQSSAARLRKQICLRPARAIGISAKNG